ncbi:MAG: hypothetical protein U5Q44_03880 [Dehalococcoidia bacterium]|nr:hypothetical protein [Dehalococcoidia bacterium]
MPLRKLNLMVTPYAAEQSPDGLRRLSLAEAMTIATRIRVDSDEVATNENVEVRGLNIDTAEGLTGILWAEAEGTVAFTYKDDGGRTVWLENVFSVGFKLEYVQEYGLGGFAVEDAEQQPLPGDIWRGIVPYVARRGSR